MNDVALAIAWCGLSFVLVYGFNWAYLQGYVPLRLVVLVNLAGVSLMLMAACLIARHCLGKRPAQALGLRREGLLGSFLWPGVITTPLAISTLAGAYVSPELIAGLGSSEWLLHVSPRPYVPLVALLTWSLSGISYFMLFQAFLYEILAERPRRCVLPAIWVLSCLLYNAPLMTGSWKLDDMLILGVLFPLVYARTRCSVGLIVTYVLVYEAPIKWAFWFSGGWLAFWALLYARAIWCLSCTGAVIYLWRRGRLREPIGWSGGGVEGQDRPEGPERGLRQGGRCALHLLWPG